MSGNGRGGRSTRPSTPSGSSATMTCMRWSDQPGYKVEVPRHFLETLAEQMAQPEKWAYLLREHARTIRKQLALAERVQGKGMRPPGTPRWMAGVEGSVPNPGFRGKM